MIARGSMLALLLLGAGIANAQSIDVSSQTSRRCGCDELESVIYDDAIHSFVVNGVEVPRYMLDSGLRSLTRGEMEGFIAADGYFLVGQNAAKEYHVAGYLRLRGGVYGDDMDDDDYKITVEQHGEFGRKYGLPAVGGCLTSVTSATVQGGIRSVAEGAVKCASGAAAAVVGTAFWDKLGDKQGKK